MEKKEKRVGKLNIIDLIVLVIAVLAVLGVALKLTGHLGGLGEEKVGTDVVFTVKVENMDRDVYENIKGYIDRARAAGKQGDQCMSNGSLLDFYITGVTAAERDVTFDFYSDGDSFITLDPSRKDRVDATFTLQGYSEDNCITKMGSQEVRIGRSHIVKSTHFEVTGTVITCQWANGTNADNAAN